MIKFLNWVQEERPEAFKANNFLFYSICSFLSQHELFILTGGPKFLQI